MKALFARLRARLGDFWYYTLMLFVACRVADVLNFFVGVWLVPKYVNPEELGAVMPLASFATLLVVPAFAFAMTFMKEVGRLAAHGEYGKLKSLMRGVFVAAGVFLVLGILVSRLLMPLFLERIRIVEGSLGVLILAYGFIGCVAPVYSNALQALKKFRTLSLISLVGAPFRFAAMVVAMPFRPLSGYFVGQSAMPGFTIFASLFALRRELSVRAERYWTRAVVRQFFRLFLAVCAYQVFGMLLGFVQQLILRQRLPAVDSGAFYMVSRFSDMSNFLSATLLVTLFPFAAELAEQGRSTRALVVKSALVMLGFAAVLAAAFGVCGRGLLALLPNGEMYSAYWWAMPWLVMIMALGSVQTFHTNTEVAAGRFGFLFWWVPYNLLFAAAMFFVSGYGYFEAYLPAAVGRAVRALDFTSLEVMLWWMTVDAALRALVSVIGLFRQRAPESGGQK